MRRKLVFATNNQHKLKEVSAILGDEIGIMSLEDINCYADIPETADTLEGNALLKAEFVHNNYNIDCFSHISDSLWEIPSLISQYVLIPPEYYRFFFLFVHNY